MRDKYFWLTPESQTMLERGYLLPGQTVEEKIDSICKYAAAIYKKPELKEQFKELFERGWTSLSSPIWANFGEDRGLPISCVTKDTWINTDKGGKMAKDIVLGDKVLTHKNRFRPITAIMPTKDKNDIWKLKVGTRMTNLYITGNHPVLTNLGWVKVEDLDPYTHLVAVNGKLEYNYSDYTIDLKPFTRYNYILEGGMIKKAIECNDTKKLKRNKSDTHVTYYAKPYEKIEVDADLSWALGIWFAEGSLTTNDKQEPNGIRITVNDKDESWVAQKWLDIMCDKFNLNGNISKGEVFREGKTNSWLNVNLNSLVIGEFFASFGKGCKEKEIPEWILNLPKNKLQKFLDGLLLGDGTLIKDKGIRITLANPKLLLATYNIGLKLGKEMSLQMQEKAGKLSTTNYVYTLTFRKYLNSVNRHASNSGVKFNDGLVYCSIKTLEKTNRVEDVYDFTVEEDHSFSCAGVVVHNCFNSYIPDNLEGIYSALHEVAIMTQKGGGTSGYFGKLRAIGTPIKGGGISSGMMSFLELYNNTTKVVSQAGVRRGAFAAYLDIDHPEIEEFLKIKDKSHSMQSINTAVNVTDVFMQDMLGGDKEKRELWAKIIKSRREKGIPYINFIDTINKNKPQIYKDTNSIINSSNLCVSPNTQILTRNGYVCIEDLKDEVIDIWNGKQWSEVKVLQTGKNQKLLRVKTDSGYELDCTEYHKFYIQKGYIRGVGENKLQIVEKRANEHKKEIS